MPDPTRANPQKTAILTRALGLVAIGLEPGPIDQAEAAADRRRRAPGPKVLRRSPSDTLQIRDVIERGRERRIFAPYFNPART